MRLNQVYAISADSPNQRAAWEFVKLVNGIEASRAASRSLTGQLPTRGEFMKEVDGKSTEAFYALRPKGLYENIWSGAVGVIPDDFYGEFRSLLGGKA